MRTHGWSVQVKTCENPHDRALASRLADLAMVNSISSFASGGYHIERQKIARYVFVQGQTIKWNEQTRQRGNYMHVIKTRHVIGTPMPMPALSAQLLR